MRGNLGFGINLTRIVLITSGLGQDLKFTISKVKIVSDHNCQKWEVIPADLQTLQFQSTLDLEWR